MPMKHTLLFHTDPAGGGGGTGGGNGAPDPGGQGDEPPEGGGSGSGGGSGGDQPNADDDRVKKANAEAAKYRKERNDLQKRVEELEGAGKTEVERLTTSQTTLAKERDTLAEENRVLRVQQLAGRAGIAQEARADAASLLPKDAVDDWTDEAKVEKALRDLVKSKPYLAGKTREGSDGGEGGGSRNEPGDMNAMIRAAAGRE